MPLSQAGPPPMCVEYSARRRQILQLVRIPLLCHARTVSSRDDIVAEACTLDSEAMVGEQPTIVRSGPRRRRTCSQVNRAEFIQDVSEE